MKTLLVISVSLVLVMTGFAGAETFPKFCGEFRKINAGKYSELTDLDGPSGVSILVGETALEAQSLQGWTELYRKNSDVVLYRLVDCPPLEAQEDRLIQSLCNVISLADELLHALDRMLMNDFEPLQIPEVCEEPK